MSTEFFNRSKTNQPKSCQEDWARMANYLRSLAVYRRANAKSMSRRDLGRIDTEIHYIEKKILRNIMLVDYLLLSIKNS